MGKLAVYEQQMLASPDQQISLTDPDSRSMATNGRGSGVVGYNVQVAVDPRHHLIVAHEVTNSGSDRAQARIWATHFLTKTLPKVAPEMAVSVLAYNLTRVMNIVRTKPLMAAIVA